MGATLKLCRNARAHERSSKSKSHRRRPLSDRPGLGVNCHGQGRVCVKPPCQGGRRKTLGLGQPEAKRLLIENTNRNLQRTGLTVGQISVRGTTAQIRLRTTIHDAPAQTAGRIARALTQTMPALAEVLWRPVNKRRALDWRNHDLMSARRDGKQAGLDSGAPKSACCPSIIECVGPA